jgi:hypothetical protein
MVIKGGKVIARDGNALIILPESFSPALSGRDP